MEKRLRLRSENSSPYNTIRAAAISKSAPLDVSGYEGDDASMSASAAS